MGPRLACSAACVEKTPPRGPGVPENDFSHRFTPGHASSRADASLFPPDKKGADMPRKRSRRPRHHIEAWREELLRETVRRARRERLAQSRLSDILSAVPGYNALKARELALDAQAEIDRIELRLMNAARETAGLPPLGKLPPE